MFEQTYFNANIDAFVMLRHSLQFITITLPTFFAGSIFKIHEKRQKCKKKISISKNMQNKGPNYISKNYAKNFLKKLFWKKDAKKVGGV